MITFPFHAYLDSDRGRSKCRKLPVFTLEAQFIIDENELKEYLIYMSNLEIAILSKAIAFINELSTKEIFF